MPELPEIEVLKRSLIKNVLFSKILKIKVNNKHLRYKVPQNLNKSLSGKTINNVSRISKYLLINFKPKMNLSIHLGMSGTIHLVKDLSRKKTNASFYKSQHLPKKHNHIIINLDNGVKLIYNDPRRFGYFKLFKGNFFEQKPFNRLGPDPFSIKFNYQYINNFIKNRKKNIKNLIMDQNFVSGIGNIYANEILFYCYLNPLKNASKLSKKNIFDLIKFTKKVLNKAIVFGGSTIKDFKKSNGDFGKFQQNFKVYGKNNISCPRLKCNGIISRILMSNRSTFFCSNCQK